MDEKQISSEDLWLSYVYPALYDQPLPQDAIAVLKAAEPGTISKQYATSACNNMLHQAAKNGNQAKILAALLCGADVNADGGQALWSAASNGYMETVALLLEKGADVNASKGSALRFAAGNGHTETVALLTAYDTIEKVAQDLTRRYAYASAAIAAKTGLDVGSFLTHQKDLLTRRHDGHFPKNKAYSDKRPSLEEMVQGINEKLGIKAYTNINNLLDVVQNCAQSTVLPQIKPANYKGNDSNKNQKLTQHVTAALLLGGMNIEQIFAFSHSAHQPENGIPSSIRNLKSGEWHRLMPDFTSSSGIHITALTSIEQLSKEGRMLAHCVGNGGYDAGCMNGQHHILSVRDAENNPIATLCVDEHLAIQKEQFYGQNNNPPPQQAKKAWQELTQQVKEKKFVLNQQPKSGWGETAESKASREQMNVSELERTIGYRFDEIPKKADLCARHYLNKLKYARYMTSRTGERRMGENVARLEQRRITTGFPIPDFTPNNFVNAIKGCLSLLREKDKKSLAELLPETVNADITEAREYTKIYSLV